MIRMSYWLYRFIRFWVKLFSPTYEISGCEYIPEGECVIVGNHCHMYGPIEAELYTPGSHYTWCAGELMHAGEVAVYAYKDFWSSKPESVRWFYRILSYLITPLAVCIFNNAHTIGVYHDSRILNTFRRTQECLEGGARIVIFPEQHIRYNNIIYRFQDRFIDLARTYHKKTGGDLAFVPMYLAPDLKRVIYGEPVYYNMASSGKDERARVAYELMERITRIAVSLPEHTVIPYPNMPSRKYGKNLPQENYHE